MCETNPIIKTRNKISALIGPKAAWVGDVFKFDSNLLRHFGINII